MRIIQIGAYMSGAQKVIEEEIHQYAMNQGHHSRVLYVRGQSDLAGVVRCESQVENVLSRVLRRFFGKKPQFARLQTLRMIKQIRRFKPDVIHLHVLHGGCMDYQMLLRYLVRIQIPVVYTMHDMWAFTGGCYHYVYDNCAGYLSGCSDCKARQQNLDAARKDIASNFRIKKELLLGLEKLHCVTVSQWVAAEVRKSFLTCRPVHVIYNGIECRESVGTALQRQEDQNVRIRVICVAAYWNQHKGLNTIYELARLLDQRFQIMMVGHVDEADKSIAPDNIVFLGYCENREKLFTLFQRSDIHVTASHAETFGMTMVEAAMAGVRSIGFACTAIEEVLEMVRGVCVTEKSAEALYQAVLKVVDEGNCHLAADEVATITEQFSIKRMIREYMELYETVVS